MRQSRTFFMILKITPMWSWPRWCDTRLVPYLGSHPATSSFTHQLIDNDVKWFIGLRMMICTKDAMSAGFIVSDSVKPQTVKLRLSSHCLENTSRFYSAVIGWPLPLNEFLPLCAVVWCQADENVALAFLQQRVSGSFWDSSDRREAELGVVLNAWWDISNLIWVFHCTLMCVLIN